MDISEAARLLRDMYHEAPHGEQTTYIRLFGIKYADEIRSMSLKELVGYAGLLPSYQTEVYKGIKLSKYVTPIQPKTE